MFLRGHREADGLDARSGERVDIRDYLRAEFPGNLSGVFGTRIDDAREFHALEFAPHANVVASELAGANDCNANGFVAHDFVFA
jgi:hypothetical protein